MRTFSFPLAADGGGAAAPWTVREVRSALVVVVRRRAALALSIDLRSGGVAAALPTRHTPAPGARIAWPACGSDLALYGAVRTLAPIPRSHILQIARIAPQIMAFGRLLRIQSRVGEATCGPWKSRRVFRVSRGQKEAKRTAWRHVEALK